MARVPRLVVANVALHVVQRGVNREACFRHDSDRLVYLSHLRDLLAMTQCGLHAYCLMTNHVHLLLTPSAPEGCATLMRELGQRYVPYFNRRYGRTGTLWEGRFKSCLVDSSQYVLACYRYIEANPVRAQMVSVAAAFPWSSHGGNTGAVPNTLLAPHAEFLALGHDVASRQRAYRQLFDENDDPQFLAAVRDATHGGYALVGEGLEATLLAKGARARRGKPGRRAEVGPQDTITAELDLSAAN